MRVDGSLTLDVPTMRWRERLRAVYALLAGRRLRINFKNITWVDALTLIDAPLSPPRARE